MTSAGRKWIDYAKAGKTAQQKQEASEDPFPVEIDDWHRIFAVDFTQLGPDMSGLSFCRFPDITEEGPPLPTGPGGMDLHVNDMFWLKDLDMRSDVRVDIRALWPENVDGLEIFINASRRRQLYGFAPPGYGCQFGGYGGTVNFICRNETPGLAYPDAGIRASFKSHNKYKLTLEREADRISQYVDGEPKLTRIEPLPLPGQAGGAIAIRCWEMVQILSVAVYGKSRFIKTNVFEQGDSAFIADNKDNALRLYLSLAEEYAGQDIQEQALTKAYLVACRLENSEDLKRRILRKLEADHPSSPYILTLMEADVLHLWKAGQYRQALDKALRIFESDPQTRIIPDLLGLPRIRLEPQIATDLAILIAKTQDLVRVNISNFGMSDMGILSQLNLDCFSCENNQISDLESIRGMKLSELNFNSNQVTSLAPLREMQLVKLRFPSNKVESLEGLAGMPLQILNCSDNPVKSLEPLRGMAIQKLHCDRTAIESLAGLEEMPLKHLNASNTPITDLKPLTGTVLMEMYCSNTKITSLEGLPTRSIRILQCGNNSISDLEPLRKTRLWVLDCSGTAVKSLEPLSQTGLMELDCSNTEIETLEPLNSLPLKKLSCRNTKITSLEPLRSCPIKYLDCRDSLLKDLGPLEDSPPEYLEVASGSFPADYIEKLISKWSSVPRLRETVNKMQIQRAFDLGDGAFLRKLATVFKGRKYAYIAHSVTWEEADSLARKFGGHLITIRNKEENDFAYSLIASPISGGGGTWLGVVSGPDGRDVWSTGEPVTFTSYYNNSMINSGKHNVMPHFISGAWTTMNSPADMSGFIIEWSD